MNRAQMRLTIVFASRPLLEPVSTWDNCCSLAARDWPASIVPSSLYRNFIDAVLPVGRSHSTISSGPSA